MSENTNPPPRLPDRDQIEHLISLLTEVLEKKSDRELTETIQEFVSSNERVLQELQRIAATLEKATQAVPGHGRIDHRLHMIDRQISSMNQNLARLLSAMMAPLDK